jgi:uncharacterized protein YndB with AHSA1/START domain
MTQVRSLHIELDHLIAASHKRVFTALTSGAAVWWGPPCLEDESASDLVFEARLGGRLYEKWGKALEEKDADGAILGIVMAIKPSEYIRLEGPFGLNTGAVHGTVTIRLLDEGKHKTRVKLSHDLLGVLDNAVEQRFASGWKILLERLEHYVREGHGHGLRANFHGV